MLNKKWVLYHTKSGFQNFFDTQEQAECERFKCYQEWKNDQASDEGYIDPDYIDYCEYWEIEEILDPEQTKRWKGIM